MSRRLLRGCLFVLRGARGTHDDLRNPHHAQSGNDRERPGKADTCRLADGDYLVTLPENGQVFRFPNTGGDTEVLFSIDGAWRRVFRWHAGHISFVAPKDFDNEATRMRVVARALAESLQARIVGDEGEFYD